MPTVYHYTPLAPLREEYRDNGSNVILSIPCKITGTRISEICLLGTDQTVYAIRITIPLLTDDKILPKEEEIKITGIVEHMLGVLRLTYDLEADFIRRGNSYIQMTSFVEDGHELNFEIEIWKEIFQGYKINAQNVGAVFCETAKMKAVVRLCADALHVSLPLQYRYLSLYKLFERDFKKNKSWEDDFKKLLKPFDDEFRALKLTKMKLFAFIIDLRNKCAHIVLGRKNMPGILGLESPDARLVEEFMPLFWKIAQSHLNQKYSGVLETSVFPLVPPRRAE